MIFKMYLKVKCPQIKKKMSKEKKFNKIKKKIIKIY